MTTASGRLAPRESVDPSSGAFHALLELARARVDQHGAHRGLDRPADEHAEHAPGVGVERVGRARALAPEVLQRPGPLDRLQVALLLRPRQPRRRVVAEADPRLDRPDLEVILRLDEGRA